MSIIRGRRVVEMMVDRKTAMPIVIFLILLLAAISGCTGHSSTGRSDNGTSNVTVWSFTINGDPSKSINSTLYARLINCSQAYNTATDIPPSGGILLEYFLYYYGVYPVTSVSYNGTTLNWTSVVYQSDEDNTPVVTPNG